MLPPDPACTSITPSHFQTSSKTPEQLPISRQLPKAKATASVCIPCPTGASYQSRQRGKAVAVRRPSGPLGPRRRRPDQTSSSSRQPASLPLSRPLITCTSARLLHRVIHLCAYAIESLVHGRTLAGVGWLLAGGGERLCACGGRVSARGRSRPLLLLLLRLHLQ